MLLFPRWDKLFVISVLFEKETFIMGLLTWINHNVFWIGLLSSLTLHQTNMAPENGWLGDYFPIGMVYFQVRTEVSSLTATVQSKWSTHVEVHQEICCHAWRRKWPTLVCKQNIPTMTNGVFDRDKQRSKWWGKWICKYMSRAPTRPLFSKVKARPKFQSKQGSFGFQAKKPVSSRVQMIAGQSVNSPCVFGSKLAHGRRSTKMIHLSLHWMVKNRRWHLCFHERGWV